MQGKPTRETVDLSGFPNLVLVLLGFKARRVRALPALFGIGRGLTAIQRNPPDGLLHGELFLFGWNHIGIRQYWRDLDSLEVFTRASPHMDWWKEFLRDTRGSGFWHETYDKRGGVEAIYINMPEREGLGRFATIREATGPFMSSRDRLKADRQM